MAFVREDVLRGSAGQLRWFPEISRDKLIRYFTPAMGNVAFVDTGRGRGAADRLGMLVQLCTLPWLGFGSLATSTPAEPGHVKASVLVGHGALDPHVPSLMSPRSPTR